VAKIAKPKAYDVVGNGRRIIRNATNVVMKLIVRIPYISMHPLSSRALALIDCKASPLMRKTMILLRNCIKRIFQLPTIIDPMYCPGRG
jgi:hypothetical protein